MTDFPFIEWQIDGIAFVSKKVSLVTLLHFTNQNRFIEWFVKHPNKQTGDFYWKQSKVNDLRQLNKERTQGNFSLIMTVLRLLVVTQSCGLPLPSRWRKSGAESWRWWTDSLTRVDSLRRFWHWIFLDNELEIWQALTYYLVLPGLVEMAAAVITSRGVSRHPIRNSDYHQ